MFNPNQIPRPAGPPASSTPLRDYLGGPHPGVDGAYVVLPRAVMESMSLPWQQQMTYLLAEFHQAVGHLNWPLYRVVPSRYEKLVDLDEDQLTEVGAMMEIDGDGDLVYRERNGRRIDNAAEATVLVSCPDPLLPQPPAAPRPQSRPAPPPAQPPVPPQGAPQGPPQAAPPPQGSLYDPPPEQPPAQPRHSAPDLSQYDDFGPRPTPPSGPPRDTPPNHWR